MVAAVAQNTRLKKNLLQTSGSVKLVIQSKLGIPMRPKSVSSPRSSPAPRTKKPTVPRQKSIRFFIRIFAVFLARVSPASNMAKPACMKNTNAAPIKNHISHISSIADIPPKKIFEFPLSLKKNSLHFSLYHTVIFPESYSGVRRHALSFFQSFRTSPFPPDKTDGNGCFMRCMPAFNGHFIFYCSALPKTHSTEKRISEYVGMGQ